MVNNFFTEINSYANDEKTSLIFTSDVMKSLKVKAETVAKYPTTVLLEGESGTGKELFAELIHNSSPRRDQKFIKINCAAFPDSLIDTELFGHEKGAFTGAFIEKMGLFEQANEGTILLDEIGELPISLQAKLLRVLQEKQIRKIGSTTTKTINIRLIASTNRNLQKEVEKGTFRLDLFYRLSVVHLMIPPLKERKQDVISLIEYYLNYFCKLYNIKKKIDHTVKTVFCHYEWPGNVRQLINTIEQLVILSPSVHITLNDLPYYLSVQENQQLRKETIHNSFISNEDSYESLEIQLSRHEAEIIKRTFKDVKSIRKASKVLGISHSTLIRKMKKYNIEP